ncbi:hypothetical protein [Chryseobacterium shigense]|uniref:DUF3139 domain-containing protein n=1 Tax=Chryseobacterium shigense TaxID=297244 RepID=A0A841NH81_9FLAO|nr:hypothetical protein [Chryseobacterium shigense]MBB6370669.1 hypothetical protein [Chryseobacterium shigense]
MKKAAIIISFLLLFFIILFSIYWNLPIGITRKTDIEAGNKIIQNIENYQKNNGMLPDNNDYKTLKNLGLKQEDSQIYLDYTTDNKGSFELTYLEGFDGPYLLWNSKERIWTIDYPKIYK